MADADIELLRAIAEFVIAHPELSTPDALTLYHAMGIVAGIVCPPTVGPS